SADVCSSDLWLMSALGQKRTRAVRQMGSPFDHLIWRPISVFGTLGPSTLAAPIVLQVALFHQKSAHFPHEVGPRRQPVAALIMGRASRGHPAAPRLGTGEARPTI